MFLRKFPFTATTLRVRCLVFAVGSSDYISIPGSFFFFRCCVNQWDCSLEFMGPAYGNLPLIGLVPRNNSTKAASGTMYTNDLTHFRALCRIGD